MAKNTDSAAKWLASMQNPQTTTNYVDGINASTVNPMERAAAQEAAYLSGIQDAVQSGRMKNALLTTPVAKWKGNSTGKGAARLSAGAKQSYSAVQAHFSKWTPIYRQVSDACAAMPSGGMQNALAKVQTAIAMMKQAAGKSTN